MSDVGIAPGTAGAGVDSSRAAEAERSGLYVAPREVADIKDCVFYHTMDIPGYGRVDGQFDLRGHEDPYLGFVDFCGKRVLEIGTASGYLCFHMERRGAEMVSFDLSEHHSWDLVPFHGLDPKVAMEELRAGIRKMNNAYWLCHRVFNSKARVVYGSVYDVPEAIGPVDITTFCAVLVHFRDPIGALQSALRLTKDTVIVTEVLGGRSLLSAFLDRFRRPRAIFLPNHRVTGAWDADARVRYLDACLSWWALSPWIVREWLAVCGFTESKINYHRQLYLGKRLPSFTVVARRRR
jgi:SAM-dependent methyltransferase